MIKISEATLDDVKSLNEVEKTLLEKIMSQLVRLMKEPWENVVDISPEIDKVETNSQLLCY